MYEGRSATEMGRGEPCACHGVPMRWNKRYDIPAGGYWHCCAGDAERNRRWVAANKDRRDRVLNEWRRKNRDHLLAYQRKYRYGIEPAAYDALFERQRGLCALCDIAAKDAPKGSLHIDHSHQTGRTRGLLCLRCNSALERLERSGWLDRALAYLAK